MFQVLNEVTRFEEYLQTAYEPFANTHLVILCELRQPLFSDEHNWNSSVKLRDVQLVKILLFLTPIYNIFMHLQNRYDVLKVLKTIEK